MKVAHLLALTVLVALASAQTYCTADSDCTTFEDMKKYCNMTASPAVCASMQPVTTPGAAVPDGFYCEDMWQEGSRCWRGIRPGGAFVGDLTTDQCLSSRRVTSGTTITCAQRSVSQADCDYQDTNCQLGYSCIETTAGHVCKKAGMIEEPCGDPFGPEECAHGTCVGHVCKAHVGKGQRCEYREDAACPAYYSCNMGKCIDPFSLSAGSGCTTGEACKSGLCYLGHCFTNKRNDCTSDSQCDFGYCKAGKCFYPLKPVKDLYDCLKTNQIDGNDPDTLFALCPSQYAAAICTYQCTVREDLRYLPEILALSSVDCQALTITTDNTAVANPSNIFKNCAAIANYAEL